ncbi:unnamed protein product [Cuscuta campestris]|uniref:mTERF domain-containing protein, mitochondrial n=1 Tax=Cuscuta campestris TaxID=132261 RepID=A0A484KCW8_9ASTE|nr:unnamed protein product [Cuscuta campestris]
MFNFACKAITPLRLRANRSSLTLIQLYVTKSGDEPLERAKKKSSFVVTYLVDKCGFPPERAISASKYVTFKTPAKPDSVLSFLKIHGFTEAQVSELVRKCPSLLLCRPQNTLLPKIEFFKSLGFTVEDYTTMLCGSPSIFTRSLENSLSPTIDFLKPFLSSPGKLKVPLKRNPWIFSSATRSKIKESIQCLAEMGVPESRIAHYLHHQPRLFTREKDEFVKVLEEVKGMGFRPYRKTFLVAVHVFCSMSKLTWEKKICLFKKWGLTEDQILDGFLKHPWLMASSEGKIQQGMEFFVNKMGFKPSDILKTPVMLMLSLEKRTIPRCIVYQTLTGEGLLEEDLKLLTRMLLASEKKFVIKFVKCYENEVPNLVKLYP